MERFRRIGIFLNGSPADSAVLSFAGKIADVCGSERLHAVHFNERGPSIQEVEPEPDAFSEQVTQGLPPSVARRTVCEVHKGGGISEVLTTARDKDLDLVVAGRRLPHSQLAIGSGFMKLARKAPCDVLVVPEQARPHFGRLLVPVDFSEHARMALQVALDLAQASGESNPQIVCQHVFSCGYGYKSTGVSLGEVVRNLESKIQKEYQQFVRDVDPSSAQMESVFTLSEQLAEVVSDLGVARKMDLVVLGSRGKGLSAASILGVTAERILVFSALPVLVVKKKGETRGILDALLGV